MASTTAKLLRLVGIEGDTEHDTPHTEAEIRALIRLAHGHGELTRSEHRLIHAVFEFDDMICRRVMVPRSDAVFFEVNQPLEECVGISQRPRHTRYCRTSRRTATDNSSCKEARRSIWSTRSSVFLAAEMVLS